MNMNLVKKTKEDLELDKKHLEERKPFKVIYDGEDFGIFKYENGRYQSELGFIDLESMARCIQDDKYFIKLEII